MATGEAEAIFVRANATARGIDAVANSLNQGQEAARGAVSLSVAEKYVEAFGRLAKEGTAVVVPGNVGDMGGMIASAMAVYGKVSEGQAKSMAKGVIEAPRNQGSTASKAADQSVETAQDAAMGKTDEVAKSVLQGFEDTRRKR